MGRPSARHCLAQLQLDRDRFAHLRTLPHARQIGDERIRDSFRGFAKG